VPAKGGSIVALRLARREGLRHLVFKRLAGMD